MYYGDLNVLKDSVLWNKACDVIVETATVTEQEPEADTQAAQEQWIETADEHKS